MKTDSLFFSVFKRLPAVVLELAGLEVSGEGYSFHAEEIKQTAFRLDGVLKPPEGDRERPYVFAEVQFQPDDDFYPRFFSEILLYLRQHPMTNCWYAAVVYPDRATERAAPTAFASLLSLPEVRRIYLEDLPSEAVGALGLIALIVCPPERAAAQARRIVSQPVPSLSANEILNFIETILVYKLPKLTREEIKHMIGVQDIDLRQTRFYQDVFTEGRQEGRQEGERIVLKRQLERKFGPLDVGMQQRLSQADADTVLMWSDRILDARSVDEVFAPVS